MSEFSNRRYHRLFGNDGRSVVIAMDHAFTDGAVPGLESPQQVLEQIVAGGADTILTSIGIARHFSKQLKDVGVMIRCDGATSPLLEHPRQLLLGIEDILTTGADAAAAMYFPGIINGRATTMYFPQLASEAHRWNVPIMAEALPYGFEDHPSAREVGAVADTCRMAAENGADIVKTFYTGERDSFKKVIRSCYVPVLVLGGPKTRSDREFLTSIRDAMDAGASGIVIGRNVWQAPSPVAMAQAIVALVHEDDSVDNALSILQDGL